MSLVTRHFLSLLLVTMISANSLPLSSKVLSSGQMVRQHQAIDEPFDAWSQTDGMQLVTAPGSDHDTFLPIILRGGSSGGMVFVSDDFNRANADRCALGATSNYVGGNKLYFVPLWPGGGSDPTNPIGANIVDQTLQNNGMDFGGVMLTKQPGACDNTSIRGVDLGQDLYVGVDVKVPTDSNNHITQAGPFLRGRAAARGDEISGGLNTGYWAILDSTGYVHVVDLADGATITDFTLSEFHPDYFYRVELAAKSILIQVKVYGPIGVGSRWAGSYQEMTASATISGDGVEIFSDGTVGVNFGAGPNRGLIGGQEADNLIVSEYRSLD